MFKKLGIQTFELFGDDRKLEEHSPSEIFKRIDGLVAAGKLSCEWSYIPKPK